MKSILIAFVLIMTVCQAMQSVFPLTHKKVHASHQLSRLPSKYSRFGGGSIEVLPLKGDINTWGEFFIELSIGYPQQWFQLQVDTGSTDLVVYGAGCDGCGKNNSEYDPDITTTGGLIPCDDDGEYDCDANNCWLDSCPFEDDYGGGNGISGPVGRDIVTIGQWNESYATLGVIMEVTGGQFEATSVDGILGFAGDQLSGWGGEAVIDLMEGDGLLEYFSFSMCLIPDQAVMEMGTDYTKDSSIVWTPLDPDDGTWMNVYMNDLRVDNVSLGLSPFWDLNANGVIVDSGTTLFIVNSDILDALQKAITAYCPKVDLVGVCNATQGKTIFDGTCFPMTDQDREAFPDINIVLYEGPFLTMKGPDYLFEGTNVTGVWCLGIQVYDSLPVIIGDVVMQNYHVVFDKNLGQVGFGPLSGCPTTKKTKPFRH